MANLNAVLSRPRINETYARNAFDRSEVHRLNWQLGALTPFFAEPFIKGSHVKLNLSSLVRTANVNTAAMVTVDTHYEFFCVPLRLLDSNWYQKKLQVNDIVSTAFYSTSQSTSTSPLSVSFLSNVPKFNLAQVHNELKFLYQSDSVSKQFAVGASRLLDLLGYGFVDPSAGDPQQSVSSFMCNPYKLLAYQKIYFDHFRNTAYESNNPFAYNIDHLYARNSNTGSITYEQTRNFTTLRYVNYRKDYFQALYPGLNYVLSVPAGVPSTLGPSFVTGVLGNPYSDENLTYTSGAPDGRITSVQNIRAAFAIDRLLRASAYAPKHVKDQMLARYGVEGTESDMESIRIASFMNDIQINPVLQTAPNTLEGTTDEISGIGSLGGVGIGSIGFQKDDVDFTCEDDCIIMGVLYTMPRSTYDSRLVRNWNAKISVNEFFIPEYMDLGLQPVRDFELSTYGNGSYTIPSYPNDIAGYQDRYMEYKHGIDMNHGLFNSGEMLQAFTNHTNDGYYKNLPDSGVSADFFKVKPSDLDSVFVLNYTPDGMAGDQFFGQVSVKCISNQNMSVHGQPRNGSL